MGGNESVKHKGGIEQHFEKPELKSTLSILTPNNASDKELYKLKVERRSIASG